MEKRVIEILDKMTKDYMLDKAECGMYQFKTYVDYKDVDIIHDIVRKEIGDIKILADDIEDIIDYLTMEMLDDLVGYDTNVDYIVGEFEKHTDSDELVKYFRENFYDYVEIYYGELDYVESTELDIDITFSTYTERNYDMGLIRDILDNALDIQELEDTGVGVLLNYLGEDVNILKGDSTLGQQFKDELYNVYNNMNEMTIGVRATLGDLIKISNKEVDNIIIDKDSITGLYSPWVGGGSILGIELPNDITIPLKDLYNNYDDVGVVGITTSGYKGYSMEEVYGLVKSARKLITVE